MGFGVTIRNVRRTKVHQKGSQSMEGIGSSNGNKATGYHKAHRLICANAFGYYGKGNLNKNRVSIKARCRIVILRR